MHFQRALLPVHFYTFVHCYFALFVYCVSCSELHWHYVIGMSEKEGGIFAVMIHDTEALNGANKSRSCDHNSSSIILFQVLHALENFNGLHSTLVSLSLLVKLNFLMGFFSTNPEVRGYSCFHPFPRNLSSHSRNTTCLRLLRQELFTLWWPDDLKGLERQHLHFYISVAPMPWLQSHGLNPRNKCLAITVCVCTK